MKTMGWPFLVSRNKILGYQTVVAPDFMIEQKIAGILANEAGGDVTRHPKKQKLKTPAGVITLIYRVVNAADQDASLVDEHGRPVLRIEGIVVKGRVNGLEITEAELHEAHQQVENDFKEFWKSTRSRSVKPSYPFNLPLNGKVDGPSHNKPVGPVSAGKPSRVVEPDGVPEAPGFKELFDKVVRYALIASLVLNFLLAIYISSLHREIRELRSPAVADRKEVLYADRHDMKNP